MTPFKAIKSIALFGLAMLFAPTAFAQQADGSKSPNQGEGSKLIAIDVLLQTDAVMMEHAKAVNAQLRKNYPRGYALDAAHTPHVSLVQRFVRTSDLDAVKAAVTKALQSGPTVPIELTASGIDSVEWSGLGVVVYKVERSEELRQLASKVEAAVEPFAVNGGTADAFVQPQSGQINSETIKWVEDFVPNSSGKNYQPHVTLGTAQVDYAKSLEKEPFEDFKFRGVDVAIYHLGNFGTAQEKLWSRK